jgi:ribosomal protein L29
MKKDFKNKTENELVQALSEKRNALRTFRFAIAGSKTRNMKEGKGVKKEIARILTELNKRKASA